MTIQPWRFRWEVMNADSVTCTSTSVCLFPQEALGALLADYDHIKDPNGEDLSRRLHVSTVRLVSDLWHFSHQPCPTQTVFHARYDRVTNIQAYSRAQAKPGTAAKGSEVITM